MLNGSGVLYTCYSVYCSISLLGNFTGTRTRHGVSASQPIRLAGLKNVGIRRHFRFIDQAARAFFFFGNSTPVESRAGDLCLERLF